MLAESVFCFSGCKDAKDTLVRKSNIELSTITTVFIDHTDATCDLFQHCDKEGREGTLAEETQYSRKVSYFLFRNRQFNFRNCVTKKGRSSYWSTACSVHTGRILMWPSYLHCWTKRYGSYLCCIGEAGSASEAHSLVTTWYAVCYSYMMHCVWSWSLWNDFAAGISGYLQHNGRGHLEQLVAHVVRKCWHCWKRVWNILDFKLCGITCSACIFMITCYVLKSSSLRDVFHLVKIKNELRARSEEYGVLLPNNTFLP
jgi:hypothetical protein